MEDDAFKRILQDKQFHLQLKSEQKEIKKKYKMCWKEKIQWQCYPRVSERACVFSPLFGQGKVILFLFLWLSVIHYYC
jgi:hypothetical protein